MNRLAYLPIILLSILSIILMSLFTVDQRQYAVVFQLGEAVRVIDSPGLNIKVPFIQNVLFFDKRILDVSVEAKELTASDEKRVIVDAFAKFKITDTVTFFKTVRNQQGAKLRLNKILESSIRKVIGKSPLITLLTEERSQLMLLIRDSVDKEAKAFGIDIVDVRILKADLPKENSAAIYLRMQTEREKEAKQIRAEGREASASIRAMAEKERKIIIASAYTYAQEIKGEGDGEAAKIFNAAYSKDPEFYKFYRSLVAYKETLSNSNTSFVLSPNAAFLQYLGLGK